MPSDSRSRQHDTADTSELPDIQTNQDADEDNDADAHEDADIGLQDGINLRWACAEHAVQSDHIRTRLYLHRVICKVRDRLNHAFVPRQRHRAPSDVAELVSSGCIRTTER
jgi:hypothetical protein